MRVSTQQHHREVELKPLLQARYAAYRLQRRHSGRRKEKEERSHEPP
jgi:hypothetical protein